METNQDFKSLQTLAEEENAKLQENYPNLFPKPVGVTQTTPEDIQALYQHKIKQAVSCFFSSLMNSTRKNNCIKVAIIFPMKLSESIMGSRQAIMFVMGKTKFTHALEDDFINELQKLILNTTDQDVVKKLNYINQYDSSMTYAECIWLSLFCNWLGCSTSDMNDVVRGIIHLAETLDKFSFRLTLDYQIDTESNSSKERALVWREIVCQQYERLEQVLNRL